MITRKIFLASSAELKSDREAFEMYIGRKNKHWVGQGVFLEVVVWEDFLDTMSRTRLQDEYNRAIRDCDVFVMLFWTKVGPYTDEEFETAFGKFKATGKPVVFTYFKDAEISTGSVDFKALASLWAFQDKLKALGHFQTPYRNVEGLQLHFSQQLDKLVANGFIEFNSNEGEKAMAGDSYKAKVEGGGVLAQGMGATAVGPGGVHVGGANTGSINTGTQTRVDTGGGAYVGRDVNVTGGDFVGRNRVTTGVSTADLAPLFATLLAAVAAQAPAHAQAAAVQHVEEIEAEVRKGKQADDGKVAKLVEGLVGLVPTAVGAVVSAFATPLLGGIAGPVTKYVLGKLKAD